MWLHNVFSNLSIGTLSILELRNSLKTVRGYTLKNDQALGPRITRMGKLQYFAYSNQTLPESPWLYISAFGRGTRVKPFALSHHSLAGWIAPKVPCVLVVLPLG
jgi:hypothetical protein